MPELSGDATLDDYLAYAALNSEALRAAFYRWQAAEVQITVAGALPDPRLNYRYYIERVETRVGAQRQAFGISQAFPPPGALTDRQRVASGYAESARARYEATKLALFDHVKQVYYECYYLNRAITVLEANLSLVQRLSEVVTRRYATAQTGHADLVRIQLELGLLENRLQSLRDRRTPLAARLNALLNRSPEMPIAWPGAIYIADFDWDFERLLEMQRRFNPDLVALRHDSAARQRAIELAQRDYWPGLTAGIDWIDTADSRMSPRPSDSGKDPIIAMLSLNLPIWRHRLDAAVAEARHQHRRAVHDYQQRADDLAAELRNAWYEYDDSRRQLAVYRDRLVPLAEQSLNAVEAGFRAGDLDYTALVAAERELLDLKLAYERHRADTARHAARLALLVGRDLDESANAEEP